MNTIKSILLLGISIFLFSACGGGDSGEGLSGKIQIDGSSTVYPITEAVAEEYRNEQPDVNVTVGFSGTGGGFKKFIRKEIDINNASRSIKDKEVEGCTEAGIKYLELSVAYDGLAVVVSPENDWIETLTVADLKKIWEPGAEGKIMNWSDVNPSWPNEEINLFGPGTASGTYDYFTDVICGEEGASRADFNASEDDNVLVTGISGDKYALGFFGLAYYEENQDKLRLVGVDNGDGPILPSMETVGNGTYAPLSRPVFIYVSDFAAQRSEVKDFVNYYLSSASILSKEVGYIPLPNELYDAEKQKFKEFQQ